MLHANVGIDVSKDTLDVCLILEGRKPKPFQVENSSVGHKELLEECSRLSPGAELGFCMEATGTHHRALSRFLWQRGFLPAVMNPKRARDLSKGLGILHKNDKVDAFVLAQMLKVCPPEKHPLKSALHERLQDLSRRIERLKRQALSEKKRFGNPSIAPECSSSCLRSLEFLKNEIAVLETQWKDLMRKDEELLMRYENLNSMFGVGPATARVVLSETPLDLPKAGRKKLAGYAGVAPRENTSGKSVRKPSFVGKAGNKWLRCALYAASASLILHDDDAQDLYHRLKERGRSHKQAMVAVAAKLARRIQAVLRRETPWQTDPPLDRR
jgi:transposase